LLGAFGGKKKNETFGWKVSDKNRSQHPDHNFERLLIKLTVGFGAQGMRWLIYSYFVTVTNKVKEITITQAAM
jgi:hypothetical protein